MGKIGVIFILGYVGFVLDSTFIKVYALLLKEVTYMKKMLSFQMPITLFNKLKEEKRETGVPVSEIIRRSLARYLKKD